jgi:hypothetical protein
VALLDLTVSRDISPPPQDGVLTTSTDVVIDRRANTLAANDNVVLSASAAYPLFIMRKTVHGTEVTQTMIASARQPERSKATGQSQPQALASAARPNPQAQRTHVQRLDVTGRSGGPHPRTARAAATGD